MSLWVELYGFDDNDRIGDLYLSDSARKLVERDTFPMRKWVFGDSTYIQFTSSQFLHVAMALVVKYIRKEFDAHATLVDATDYEFKHKFIVTFVDGR
jgi:hypothetical protein